MSSLTRTPKAAVATAAFATMLFLQGMSGVSANSVDLSDEDALGTAISSITSNMVSLYLANEDAYGAWDSSKISWFASGMAWGTVFNDQKLTGNNANLATAGSAMNSATFGTEGDLLGGSQATLQETLFGKWNDDIAWWAITAMEAVDLLGQDSQVPDGATYLSVAEKTYQEVYDQYDDSTCGGGIYWNRNRDDSNQNKATYKSTITNVEFVELAARIYGYTNDEQYLDAAKKVYTWLKTINFIESDYTIIDGGNAPTCTSETRVDTTNYSYNYGLALSGLSALYTVTQDDSYLTDAKGIFAKSVQIFVDTNYVMSELCESENQCSDSRDWPAIKMQYYKSLRQYYKVADSADQDVIKQIINNTVARVAQNCDDSWWCSPFSYAQVSSIPQDDAYGQMAAAELFLSAASIYGAKSDPVVVSSTKKNGALAAASTSVLGVFAATAVLIISSSFLQNLY